MSSVMPTQTTHTANAGERGFSLVELLVTTAITTIILGATMAAMNDAIKVTDSAIQLTNMNNGLRTSMDLVVRDLLQVGQGLPSGNVVLVPTGAGSTAIRLPAPPGLTYYLGAAGAVGEIVPTLTDVAPGAALGPPSISAVIPGPGLGPVVNGQPTDMIVTIAGDSAFDAIRLTALAVNGTTMTVWNGPTISHGANITNGGADDLDPGDLIALVRGSVSALVQVTSVAGQVVTFAAADSLNLNQQAAADGTVRELRLTPTADVYVAPNPMPNPAPPPVIATEATRIRMISYYIDATTDPQRPRLMRRINAQIPTAVAFDIENFQVSYDLADGVTNPANVRMVAADLLNPNVNGRCAPDACSPNQIRKVNIMLSARSKSPLRGTRQFLRNRLLTQVSLRSLAFVDRYQ
jgi:prepilin-type N-terminal cleavage/methylation domain-containing protein